MAESKKSYKCKDISKWNRPEFKGDLMEWGKEAWKFLEGLETESENDSENSKGLISTGYGKLMKKLEKILTIKGAGPESGAYFARHCVRSKDEFSEALKEYIKKGKDEERVKKIKELREHYKKNVVRYKAGLTIVGNQNLADGVDGRRLTGMTEITIGGNMWSEIPTEKNPDLFKGIVSLKKLFLGPEVKEIGANCFKGCKNLKTIDVEGRGGDPIQVAESAFDGCKKVTKVEGDKERTKILREVIFKKKK